MNYFVFCNIFAFYIDCFHSDSYFFLGSLCTRYEIPERASARIQVLAPLAPVPHQMTEDDTSDHTTDRYDVMSHARDSRERNTDNDSYALPTYGNDDGRAQEQHGDGGEERYDVMSHGNDETREQDQHAQAENDYYALPVGTEHRKREEVKRY